MSNQSESLHLHPAPADSGTSASEFELEIAAHLIEALNLEVSPEEIDPQEALYDGSLGLDSIDILEIALTISKKYGLQLRADDQNNHQIFATMRTLAAHVQANRQT
ncbi:MAG: phosphopantetheine-binding protein [Burkholderiaceae bacterium]